MHREVAKRQMLWQYGGPRTIGWSQPPVGYPFFPDHMSRTKLLFLPWLLAAHLGLAVGNAPAQTAAAPPPPARYQVTVWRDPDGLPQNSVFAMTRTPDGYMWLGTVEGLVRFDGVRFTVFDVGNTPEIGNSHVTCLLADRAGSLWIGTAGGGLARYRDGRFAAYTTRQGLSEDYLTCLCEGPDGTVWAGTFNHGLNRWQEERWSAVAGTELADTTVTALATGPTGALWVGTTRGAFRLQGDAVAPYEPSDDPVNNNVQSLFFDHAGTLWMGGARGLWRFEGGRFVPVDLGSTRRAGPVQTIHETADGTLWIGHGNEVLTRGTGGVFATCATQSELPDNRVATIRSDPEGNVWIGTDGGGLVRLRHGRFGVYTTLDGLSDNFVRTVRQDAMGTVWIKTGAGLDRWQDGRFVHALTDDAPPVIALTHDHQGSLWIATSDADRRLCRLEAGRLVPVAIGPLPRIHLLMFDRAGDLWIGTEQGVFRFSSAGVPRAWEEGAHPPDGYVVSLFEDRAGAVWIGTVRDGVYQHRSGGFVRWTTAEGLSSNHVLSFHEEGTGALWIGTHGGGLNRFQDGKFAAVTTKNGLYDNLAFVLLADDAGELWMSGNKGIYRANLRELNACADGRAQRLDCRAYGAADGMLSRECNGGTPAGWKMHDGTLWFATVDGVAVVDPARRNDRPPTPVIETVTVDRISRPAGHDVDLKSGQSNLEIQYSALSWRRPEAVRFQYRLAGLEHGWNDAGTRRTAYFSHLPAGEYAFQVRADNGDGVWSEATASLPVVVAPPIWRTWWFLTLAAASVGTVGGIALRWRGEQLRRRYTLQQEFSRRLIAAHETERRRIAAELHDSLGQTLAMIKNSAVSGTHHAHDPAAAQAQLEQITQQSTQAISEVREIAYNLRPYLLDRLGLTKALRSMLHKIEDSSGLAIAAELAPVDGRFPPEAEMSIYRVVQESFNNVLKHADAKHVLVRLQIAPAAVELTVQDDGRGFDPAASNQEERRGFGLLGIAERVRLLGGTCVFQSQPGAGTTVSIHLPLPAPTNTAS